MEHPVAASYDNIHNISTVPCEKSKMASFASSVMKNIVASATRSRSPAKLICCIQFVSKALDQHQVLAIDLNLLLSCYSNC